MIYAYFFFTSPNFMWMLTDYHTCLTCLLILVDYFVQYQLGFIFGLTRTIGDYFGIRSFGLHDNDDSGALSAREPRASSRFTYSTYVACGDLAAQLLLTTHWDYSVLKYERRGGHINKLPSRRTRAPRHATPRHATPRHLTPTV